MEHQCAGNRAIKARKIERRDGKVTEAVLKIAKELRDGRSPRKFRVRAILKWFGASRRGSNILSEIQATLANVGLTTEPILNQAGIDVPVRFVSLLQTAPTAVSSESNPCPASEELISASAEPTNGNVQTDNNMTEAGDDLEADQEEEESVSDKPDDRPVTSQISDWTISSLRDKLDRGQLVLQPKFQREYVLEHEA